MRNLIALVGCVALVALYTGGCDDGPIPNGIPTGCYHLYYTNSALAARADECAAALPEDAVMTDLADEFAGLHGLDQVRVIFSDRPIGGFIKDLERTLDRHNHVDYIGMFSEDIDSLIETGWIEPYPIDIDEDLFLPEAIEAMKRGTVLYGIPLVYFPLSDRAKGVALSTEVEHGLRHTALDFNDFLSEPDNAQKLADAAGGVSARSCLNFQSITAFPDTFLGPMFTFETAPLRFFNPVDTLGNSVPVLLIDSYPDPDGKPELFVQYSYDGYGQRPLLVEFRDAVLPDSVAEVSIEIRPAQGTVVMLFALDRFGEEMDFAAATEPDEPTVLWLEATDIRKVTFIGPQFLIYKICWYTQAGPGR